MNKTYLKGYIKKAQDTELYEFIASTASVDRQGDSIDQSGWELDNYLKNPVILFAHNYSELPIAKAVEVINAGSSLIIKIQFASEEANPKAQQIKRLVDEGILNTTSVGFIQKERNGNIITRAELLEVSIVPVPANQDALRLAYKGLDADIVKDIEDSLSLAPEGDVEEEEEEVVTPVESEEVVIEEKSGRVISSKNRKMLETTRDALKTSLSEIEKLLAEGVATTEEDVDAKGTLVLVDRTLIEDLKFLLRSDNRTNDKILSSLKNI
jgi:HK97 family phage prohead protease